MMFDMYNSLHLSSPRLLRFFPSKRQALQQTCPATHTRSRFDPALPPSIAAALAPIICPTGFRPLGVQ